MLLSVQIGGLYGANTLEETFCLAAQAGFEGVDLNIFFDHTDMPLDQFCNPVKAAMQKYGLKIVQAHAPFPYTLFQDTDNERVLQATRKAIDICEELGCPFLIVHPRAVREDPAKTHADEWEYNIGWFSRLIDRLNDANTICCLENLMLDAPGGRFMTGPCTEPREAKEYIDELNERAGKECFGFCLDTGHALLVGMDAAEYARVLGKRLKALHVHDNSGRADEHLFPYMGVADWPRFCAALKENGYQGALNFETFGIFRRYDRRLTPQLLALLAQTGRLMRAEIEN